MTTPNVKRQNDVNALITECQVFFAFSNEQFVKGKATLPSDTELVDIGAGGFMPKKNIQLFADGMKKIHAEFKQAMKDKKARTAHILYELDNHEAYYTRDIESTLDALGDEFTREEVQQAFDGRRKVIEKGECIHGHTDNEHTANCRVHPRLH